MACQHQYLTGSSCCVAVTTKVCTSRSLHTDEFSGLQHLSHLSCCFHVYCSSPQDPAPLLQNSAEVPTWRSLVDEMSLPVPRMRPLISTVHLVAKLDQLPSSPFSHTTLGVAQPPPSRELIHPLLLSTCRPVWLHLSSSFLSSVRRLFDAAPVLPLFCPLYQCHFSSLSLCLCSCMQNTQRWSRCALSHAALSSIFLPDDWRCSSASFPPAAHVTVCSVFFVIQSSVVTSPNPADTDGYRPATGATELCLPQTVSPFMIL